jgi:glycosyltransferase involved in cell wall biosynthesis
MPSREDIAETPPTRPSIRLFFASCEAGRIAPAASALDIILPHIPLMIVSEFPADDAPWLRFEPGWTLLQNLQNLRSLLSSQQVEAIFIHLQPRVPLRKLRLLGVAIALARRPRRLYAVSEELGIFHLHPRGLCPIVRHAVWRAGNYLRYWLGAESVLRRVARCEGFAGLWTRFVSRFSRHSVDLAPGGSDLVSVFAGRALRQNKPSVLVMSPYIPYPLAHGSSVRIYNLMRSACNWNLLLICCVDALHPVPAELLEICAEVVTVVRVGSHIRRMTARPDEVEEFDVPQLRAALRQICRKWHPRIVQLEFTQMACFAEECQSLGAATILVEHDVTLDLAAQRLAEEDSWYARQQWKRWNRFERDAWRQVDRVVVMSERDRLLATPEAVVLPNGVDLGRYRPSGQEEESGRLLFIGSFRHWPNLVGIDAFVQNVWPLVRSPGRCLHIVAGPDYERWVRHHGRPVQSRFDYADITIEAFVSDPRPAYANAQIVIVPMLVSAGTNIKVLEAMAMGKALVSTSSGVHGLELNSGDGVVITNLGAAMADCINELLEDPVRRKALGQRARRIVEERFDWQQIAREQEALYSELVEKTTREYSRRG